MCFFIVLLELFGQGSHFRPRVGAHNKVGKLLSESIDLGESDEELLRFQGLLLILLNRI